MKILHVLNYGWPLIDGYTIRSAALVGAQGTVMGWEPVVATTGMNAFASGRDPAFATPWWNEGQSVAHGMGARGWERPAFGFAPATFPAVQHALERIMKRERPALVHAHHPHQSARPAYEAARKLGLPFVFELRCFNGDYMRDSARWHERRLGDRINGLEIALARNADQVVTIAEGLAERLVAGGVDERRVHIVRNAVDTTRFQPRGKGRGTREGDKIEFGYATSFARMENLDGFLLGVRHLLDTRPDLADRFHVTLAGDGEEMERLQALRAELDLADHIALPGFVPYSAMPDFLRGLDLFVVTRGHAAVAQRTTPLKPLEALAVGVPVLSTDLPALRELMGGRTDVRFVPPTPDGMAEGMARFLDDPWTGTGAIGDRAWHSEVRRYGPIYEAALGAEHSSRAVTRDEAPA